MDDFVPKPVENAPVALRLVTRIAYLDIRKLLFLTTEPMQTAPPGVEEFYLHVYQWREGREPVRKPVTALKLLLDQAAKAEGEPETLSNIPSDLFVWSDQLEAAFIAVHLDHYGEPMWVHEQPDWVPNLHGIRDLVLECPEPLRRVVDLVPVRKERSQRERAEETAKRNRRLQEAFDEIRDEKGAAAARSKVGKLKKEQICALLAKDKARNPWGVTAERIERIVKVRKRE